jgi:hypothetical protein
LPLVFKTDMARKNQFLCYLVNRLKKKIPQKRTGSRIRIRKRSVLIELLDPY